MLGYLFIEYGSLIFLHFLRQFTFQIDKVATLGPTEYYFLELNN